MFVTWVLSVSVGPVTTGAAAVPDVMTAFGGGSRVTTGALCVAGPTNDVAAVGFGMGTLAVQVL